MRFNKDKARFDLIPPSVLQALADRYTYGAAKYAPNNWLKGLPYSETYASLQRHLNAFWAGEGADPESGGHHLTAVIWNAVALLYFEQNRARYCTFDDRPWDFGEEFPARREWSITKKEATMRDPVRVKNVKIDFRIDPKIDANVRDSKLAKAQELHDAASTLLREHVDAKLATEEAEALERVNEMMPPTVPIPEGYALIGPFAVVKANDQFYDPNGKKWIEVPRHANFTGLRKDLKYKGPIIRAVGSIRLCPLCTQGGDDFPHEDDCPFKDVSWPDIKAPEEKIESGDVYVTSGGLWLTAGFDLVGLRVGGRAIYTKRKKENE